MHIMYLTLQTQSSNIQLVHILTPALAVLGPAQPQLVYLYLFTIVIHYIVMQLLNLINLLLLQFFMHAQMQSETSLCTFTLCQVYMIFIYKH